MFSSAACDADAELRIWEAPVAPHGGDEPSPVVLQREHGRAIAKRERDAMSTVRKTGGPSEPSIE